MDARGALVAKCRVCDKNIFEHDQFSMHYPRKGKIRSKDPVFTCADCAAKEAEAKRIALEEQNRKEKKIRNLKIILIAAAVIVGAIVLYFIFK